MDPSSLTSIRKTHCQTLGLNQDKTQRGQFRLCPPNHGPLGMSPRQSSALSSTANIGA